MLHSVHVGCMQRKDPVKIGLHHKAEPKVTLLATGRCVILICNGQRTMRTCLGEAARMVADDLSVQDFKGAK